jgi:hypothetical protein
MAWLEKNSSNQYRIAFRINSRKVKRSLRTKNAKQAQIRLDRIEETIKLVDSGRLAVPKGIDFVSFVLSDGKLIAPLEQPKLLTIKQLEATFLQNLPLGNLEDNTLAAMAIHLNHLKRILGQSAQVASIGTNEHQKYVNRRSPRPFIS